MSSDANWDWIKEFGAIDFGYTEELVPTTYKEYLNWIDKGHHGPLKYLADERKDKRADLRCYWSECQSAMVFIFSYQESKSHLEKFYRQNPKWNGLKVAGYTLGFQGDDYHDFLKEKLNAIGMRLQSEIPDLQFKMVLDTQAVLERDLAKRAGLGWFGKNSMFINRYHGSFFILGSLLLNTKLDMDIDSKKMDTDHCGQCTRCAEACPTSAIDPKTRTISAFDCISTFTIEEFKLEATPSPKMDLSSGYIFGCDICQDVCPWNKRLERGQRALVSLGKNFIWNKKQHDLIEFLLEKKPQEVKENIEALSNSLFKKFFFNTAFFRSGKKGLLKNLNYYLKHMLK